MLGQTKDEIRKAMVTAYNKNSLAQMLTIALNKELDEYVNIDDGLTNIVWDLLSRAEEEGWDYELLRVAHRHNPGNATLASAYEKFGMTPKISVVHNDATSEEKPSSATLERIVVADNSSMDINVWRTRLTEIEAHVCRIDIGGRGMGTGFLVGPNLVLTNHHVVEGVLKGTKPINSVVCLFDYKVLANGTRSPGTKVALDPKQGILLHASPTEGEKTGSPDAVLPTEDELDFALLKLAESVGSNPKSGGRGYEVLPKYEIDFTEGQGIIIAQHPAGKPMQIALDSKSVVKVNDNKTRVRYKTNTEGGSSGSPVFDMQFNLSALHHLGDPAAISPAYNQGVIPLHRIREKIEAAGFGGLLGSAD